LLKNTRQGLANHISHSQANTVKKNNDNILDKGILDGTLSYEIKTTVKVGKGINVNEIMHSGLKGNNVNYLDSLKSHAAILSDFCSCGHEKSYHLNVASCLKRDCKCKRFLP
jgi:hypothetical protein